MSDLQQLKCIIEAALFAAGEPLSIDRIISLFDIENRPERKIIKEMMQDLVQEYAPKGIELKELASGFQFQVKSEMAPWIQKLWSERPLRYSRALLEILAIIAYRQPTTRGEIEKIRGVSVSSSIIKTLIDHEWIRIVGHRDVPGKPALYATTKYFLDHFGLKNLDEMPQLTESLATDALEQNIEQLTATTTENSPSETEASVQDKKEIHDA